MLPELGILFEDNHVLVVDKPPGMLSQGDLTGDLDVLTLARQIIKQRDEKPGNVFLGLVHRLDRPVGGAMVLAKTSKAAGRLSKQFRERDTEKIYLAVVEGEPRQKEGQLMHRLQKDRAARITRVVEEGEPGKPAELVYRVKGFEERKSLLEVELITGLSHQIRAQLAAIGHPVLGDRKYGSTVLFKPGRIALFARSITFRHPTKKTPVTVTAELPADWPFER
jgi:23S rRNA pseudouridine1911/1915/1917 synthase